MDHKAYANSFFRNVGETAAPKPAVAGAESVQEKTRRLREARLAREAENQASQPRL